MNILEFKLACPKAYKALPKKLKNHDYDFKFELNRNKWILYAEDWWAHFDINSNEWFDHKGYKLKFPLHKCHCDD